MKDKVKHIAQKMKEQKGVLIVESAIVFPVMFFVLFFIIFIGNMYYEQAKVDSVVMQYATKGALCVADPFLYDMTVKNEIPNDSESLKVEPYRYIFGGGTISLLEDKIKVLVKEEINKPSMIFFSNSKANLVDVDAHFNNFILYSTFVVEATYKIKFPIGFMGKDLAVMEFTSRAESPVNDTDEFIRNVDMAVDLLQGTPAANVVSGLFDKMKTFIYKLSGKEGES